MEKLNVTRCTHLYAVDPERAVRGEDEARLHLWASAPTIEQTEHGPVAWWLCGRCPARVLHDPETEDGFPVEPIVVYPPSCFTADPDGWRRGERCGCPARASSEVVHLEGCVDNNARVEAHLRELDEEAGFTGPRSLARAPEPPIIVHPPTDPAPPSEELTRAIADACDSPCIYVEREAFSVKIEDAEEDISTQRYPVVETGPSVFERIERLFGRPIIGEAR